MFDPDTAISAALERTDQTELQKLQEKERAKLRSITATDAKITFGIRAVNLALDALEGIDPKADPEKWEYEHERLAEGYFLIGNIKAAIEFSYRKKGEYQAYLDAIAREGWCECPETRETSNGRIVRTNGKHIADNFIYNGRKYTLYRCNNCGFQNAS